MDTDDHAEAQGHLSMSAPVRGLHLAQSRLGFGRQRGAALPHGLIPPLTATGISDPHKARRVCPLWWPAITGHAPQAWPLGSVDRRAGATAPKCSAIQRQQASICPPPIRRIWGNMTTSPSIDGRCTVPSTSASVSCCPQRSQKTVFMGLLLGQAQPAPGVAPDRSLLLPVLLSPRPLLRRQLLLPNLLLHGPPPLAYLRFLGPARSIAGE